MTLRLASITSVLMLCITLLLPVGLTASEAEGAENGASPMVAEAAGDAAADSDTATDGESAIDELLQSQLALLVIIVPLLVMAGVASLRKLRRSPDT